MGNHNQAALRSHAPQGSKDDLEPAHLHYPELLVSLAVFLALIVSAWWTIHAAPSVISATLFGHHFFINNFRGRLQSDGFLFAILLPTLSLVELVFVGWKDSSLRHIFTTLSPSSRADIVWAAMSHSRIKIMLGAIFGLGIIFLTGEPLHIWIAHTTGINITIATWPMIAQSIIMFVLYSFFDYWNHRLDHTRLFWPLHRYHHAPDTFCIVTSVRSHPGAITGIVGVALPVAILQVSPDALAGSVMFTLILRYIIHSRINSTFGWIGRYVIQSPNHHRLHHILDMSQPVGHYGLVPIWDHLFGTWRGDADQSLAIGVSTPYRQGAWFLPDILRDYCEFWITLWRVILPLEDSPRRIDPVARERSITGAKLSQAMSKSGWRPF